MKKLIATTLCITASTLALSACETTGTGNVDTAPPYADERTASHGDAPAPAPAAERVFREEQVK